MMITEGAKDDVLMKQGSNEHPSIPDSADDSSSLPDHLFFPVWEDSLEEVAFTQTEPILKTVREPKEFEMPQGASSARANQNIQRKPRRLIWKRQNNCHHNTSKWRKRTSL